MKITKEHSAVDRRELWIFIGIKVFIIMLIALGFIIFGRQIAFAAENPKTLKIEPAKTAPNGQVLPPMPDAELFEALRPDQPHHTPSTPDTPPMLDTPPMPEPQPEKLGQKDMDRDQPALDRVRAEGGVRSHETAISKVAEPEGFETREGGIAPNDTDFRPIITRILFYYYGEAPTFEIFHDENVERPGFMEAVRSFIERRH